MKITAKEILQAEGGQMLVNISALQKIINTLADKEKQIEELEKANKKLFLKVEQLESVRVKFSLEPITEITL